MKSKKKTTIIIVATGIISNNRIYSILYMLSQMG